MRAPAPRRSRGSRSPASPGLTKAAEQRVCTRAAATTYQDHAVRNGTAYTYTITAADQAGNVTQRTVRIKPGVRLLSPGPDAHLSWPSDAALDRDPEGQLLQRPALPGIEDPQRLAHACQLQAGSKTWRFGGKRHRLAPGRYHWYVWPGYGPQRGRPLRQGARKRHVRDPE